MNLKPNAPVELAHHVVSTKQKELALAELARLVAFMRRQRAGRERQRCMVVAVSQAVAPGFVNKRANPKLFIINLKI